jgi:hypothetical protein
MVGAQAFAQGFDDGNPTGDGSFKRDHYTLLVGGGEDFVAVLGDQRLVGGDHMLAVGDGFQHQLLGGGGAADQFDEHIHLGISRHIENILGDLNLASVEGGVFPPRRHLNNLDIRAGAGVDQRGVTGEYLEGATADGSKTTNSYFDFFQALHRGTM